MLFLVKLYQGLLQWWWVMYLICINTWMGQNEQDMLVQASQGSTDTQREKQMKKEIQNIICLILSTAFHTSEVISVWNPCNPDSLTIHGALQGSSQAEGEIDGTTLDALGPLLPFLDRDSLALVDRGALALRLEEMRGFCLPKEALRDISSLLTQKGLLG